MRTIAGPFPTVSDIAVVVVSHLKAIGHLCIAQGIAKVKLQW
jgi:hypothetical protein